MQANKVYSYSSCSLILKDGEYGNNCLYLGDAQAAKDKKLLTQHKIGTVISIGEQSVPKTKCNHIQYYNIALRDQKTQNIQQHFDDVITKINKSRQIGNVLIHCYHGSSRSASFVIAYLINMSNLNFQDSKMYVKQKRPSVSPNQGFVIQLKQYYQKIQEKRNKL